jgi:actin-related protein
VEEEGFLNKAELAKEVAKIDRSLKRAHDRDMGIEPEEVVPDFPLVSVPDHQLDEEGLKDKRRQKLMKAGYDARIKLKAEKEAEKARQVGLLSIERKQSLMSAVHRKLKPSGTWRRGWLIQSNGPLTSKIKEKYARCLSFLLEKAKTELHRHVCTA